MKFLADECCDSDVVAALRANGHDVVFVPETMAGFMDNAVLDFAYKTGRVLITEDKDFGELVYRLKLPAHGVILLRINPRDRHEKAPLVLQLLARYREQLTVLFITVESDKIRVRPLARNSF